MTRAALLPAGADPFLLAYWLRHYRTWADSVDELHVAVCGPIPPEVIDYIHRFIADVPHATMHYLSVRTAHGRVLTMLLEQTAADHVVLLEEDAFIRHPAVIDEMFGRIESGETDLIASPRNGYASDSILGAATARFGEEPAGLAFWPCFLFARLADLNATDRMFDGTIWDAGKTYLGKRLDEQAHADTFIWASHQLRDMGLRVELRDGNRLDSRPIEGDVPWFHVGSLSQGHGNMWQNPRLTPEWYAHEQEQCLRLPGTELPRRVAWWQRVWDHWDGCIPEYHAEYGEGLRKFVEDFGVNQGYADGLRASYDPLVTWAES